MRDNHSRMLYHKHCIPIADRQARQKKESVEDNVQICFTKQKITPFVFYFSPFFLGTFLYFCRNETHLELISSNAKRGAFDMKKGFLAVFLVLLLGLTGCMQSDAGNKAEAETKRKSAKVVFEKEKEANRHCPDGIIDWIDFLRINGIQYTADHEVNISNVKIEKGEKIGEVSYMLNGKACSDHKSSDGDASYLPIGTAIYELKGYKSNFRVVADGKIYEVRDNPKAQTIGDLYDIEGKVEKVSFSSTEDGRHIKDFSEEGANNFIKEFISLSYKGFDKVSKNNFNDQSRVFIQIHLKDGSSTRISYWLEDNILTPGSYGTDKLKGIVLNENPPLQEMR